MKQEPMSMSERGKRGGSVKKFDDNLPFNTRLPTPYREKLEAYAKARGIAMVAALRDAIDALPEK